MPANLKMSGPRIAAGVIALCVACTLPRARAGAPSIVLTNIPAYGAQGNLGGFIRDADPATHYIAAFIYVAGAWYSKPSCADHLTPIRPDGSWTADITTSTSDVRATEIAAFLVPTNYSQPCVNGAGGLPIPSQAEAVAYDNRVNPALRQLRFADYDWSVKASAGLVGPGPNYFSDSTNNAWVDAQGALHLKITHRNGAWQCAEVICNRSFGYGQYRFTVCAPVDSLDPNVVLGLFTWSNDSAYNYREIDVELARWKNAADANNAQFVVQPPSPLRKVRFSVPAGVTNSTYTFIWQSNRVDFQSLIGAFTPAPPATNVLRSWTCVSGVPPEGGETIRFNLWLDQGTPPTDDQEMEVVLPYFEFVPLGDPPPPRLDGLMRLDNGVVRLTVNGQAERRYQIHASSNLLEWPQLGSVLATNDTFTILDTNSGYGDARFYRALAEP